MRILIVEDEEKLTELISNRLKKEKYGVDVSLDGEEGLYNALLGIYDLIILDINAYYKLINACLSIITNKEKNNEFIKI